ncbi:type II toxin-antitoxin system RelE/ParE family toxin [Lactococcus termiticola]|uniref:Type II toxin-antitoxin system RelE/ParE family toxin n=1 Tax=Lactococcus termiticola TaxID=2169526 RepID=A0A2R5HII0_9LACT|nr:type II toxin-antitoxin system RelE/ParE family toxin [Lactococcus termiticola]GBG97375.1 hypothetical protein NtB2_01515 [Lactococcus termiticola]
MSKEVILLPQAEEDYFRLRVFLFNQTHSKSVIQRFDKEFDTAVEHIKENPDVSPFEREPIRKKVQWKYLYFYIELSDKIEVIRIYHESEDWLSELLEQ